MKYNGEVVLYLRFLSFSLPFFQRHWKSDGKEDWELQTLFSYFLFYSDTLYSHVYNFFLPWVVLVVEEIVEVCFVISQPIVSGDSGNYSGFRLEAIVFDVCVRMYVTTDLFYTEKNDDNVIRIRMVEVYARSMYARVGI